MIEPSMIVKDTRKIRSAISKSFKNDSDKYIDYIIKKRTSKADNNLPNQFRRQGRAKV